jgi:cytochrome bd ubiquinol oxidase subunit II
MIETAVVFTGLAMLLYILLGGADFGAGILEVFTGKKGSGIISKAIAPVWEANHIWLIVIIVVLFNAFPPVYSTLMTYLHIPVMMALFGIIFRGTAFTFRYYDPYEDKSHRIYTFIFQLFSILTPFFLGIIMGAVILGDITTDPAFPFYTRFVAPWFNWFSVSMGVFVVLLFAFLASVYLAGEPADVKTENIFGHYAKRLLISLIVFGGVVFILAELSGMQLFRLFIRSWISVGCVVAASLLVPLLIWSLNTKKKNLSRIVAGAQAGAILIGWIGMRFPVLVKLKDAESLTVYNTAAPYKTISMMVTALIFGLAVVIPLLVYLFKVFKFSGEEEKTGS